MSIITPYFTYASTVTLYTVVFGLGTIAALGTPFLLIWLLSGISKTGRKRSSPDAKEASSLKTNELTEEWAGLAAGTFPLAIMGYIGSSVYFLQTLDSFVEAILRGVISVIATSIGLATIGVLIICFGKIFGWNI